METSVRRWWVYRFRGILVAPPLVFALICFSYETEADALIWPLGASIFLLGWALRIWAQEHLHYRLKGATHLTTTGPYSLTRNPIYVGNTLICLGATVISELIWFVPVTLFWCVGLYSIVVRYEEACLLDDHRELYREYVLQVPRWFPRTFGFKTLGLINEYFFPSVVAEAHCLLILFPYIVKDVASRYFHLLH